MTKKEFMRELNNRLSKIPENERLDALQYYDDYFAEAGIEDEMLVPDSVGTPKTIAEQIISGVTHKNSHEGYMDENSYTENTSENHTVSNHAEQNTKRRTEESRDPFRLAFIILLIIILSPVWSGFVAAAAGILFSVLVTLAGLVISFGVAGIALIVAALMSTGIGGGILMSGVGLLLLALAFLTMIPFVFYCVKFLPWLFRQIIVLLRRMLVRKEQTS